MVRKADVSFIRLDRLSVEEAHVEGHLRIAPDLAVEVLSPRDLVYKVDRKIQLYRDAGVRLIWVVNPESRTVDIHRFGITPGVIVRERDEISGDDVIPGFRCPVAALFRTPADKKA
jgi:Uma2 family endonuclease